MRQSLFLSGKKMKRSTLSTLVLLALAANQSQAADSDPYQYLIRTTLQYEGIDNPRRFNNDGDTTEELAQARISTQFSRQTTRFATNVNYQFSRLDYRKNLLRDRSMAAGSGSITWTPITDTLSWSLSHNRNVRTIDASLPTTQDNLQILKATSTGPRLTTNIGANNQLNMGYTYTKSATTFNTIFKQDRTTFDALLLRKISTSLSTGLAYNEFNTVYENNPLAKYHRKIASINNQYVREKYQVTLDVGHIESFADLSSHYVNFDLNFVPLLNTSVNMSYQDTVEDMFSNLMFARIPSMVLDDSGLPTLSTNLAQQYRSERSSASFSHQIPNSFNYSLQYSTEDREFSLGLNNQNIDTLGLTVSIPVGDELTFSAFARDADFYFERSNRSQNRQSYGLTATWLLTQSFSMQFQVTRTRQTGTFFDDVYRTANAMISVSYQFGN